MQRVRNIPIELLRALVCVIDAGSVTRAADTLALTQSAVSNQLKRLQQLLGYDVFEPDGQPTLTRRGLTVLGYARRMCGMNDQILSISGRSFAPNEMRIGLPTWLTDPKLSQVIKDCTAAYRERTTFRCDRVESLVRELSDGRLDVAFVCEVSQPPGITVAEWSEPLYWTRSPKLELKPGMPVPLVGWPGSLSDRIAIPLLNSAGLRHVVTFTSQDHSARVSAQVARLGFMVVTERCLKSGIEIARESFLPQLPVLKVGLYMRDGLDRGSAGPVLRALALAMRPKTIQGRLFRVVDLKHQPKRSRRSA